MKLVTRDGKRVDSEDIDTTVRRQSAGRISPAMPPDDSPSGSGLDQVEPAPLWDEGLSSYLLGQYQLHQRPLTLDDLLAFTAEQAIRLSDILETLFLLVIYREWSFTRPDGRRQEIDAAMLDALYARGRLNRDELDDYRGEWQPAGTPPRTSAG